MSVPVVVPKFINENLGHPIILNIAGINDITPIYFKIQMFRQYGIPVTSNQRDTL